jgi:hypothetical protein
LVLPGWQLLPEQHPEQEAQMHCPPEQVWPLAHAAHCAPPLPQNPAVVPDWQVFPAQQPAHDEDVQTQAPPTHAWPAWHAAH